MKVKCVYKALKIRNLNERNSHRGIKQCLWVKLNPNFITYLPSVYVLKVLKFLINDLYPGKLKKVFFLMVKSWSGGSTILHYIIRKMKNPGIFFRSDP